MAKGMRFLEESQKNYQNKFERIRSNVSRINSSSNGVKNKGADYVYSEDFVRCKERINAAFTVFMRLHEETINRDSVIAEALLET